MGGAVALLLHMKEPSFYNGAVLAAPMCKVNSCMKIFKSLLGMNIYWGDEILLDIGEAEAAPGGCEYFDWF